MFIFRSVIFYGVILKTRPSMLQCVCSWYAKSFECSQHHLNRHLDNIEIQQSSVALDESDLPEDSRVTFILYQLE